MSSVLLCWSIVFVWMQTEVIGDGLVSVRFVRYTNEGGLGSNGHCCDGKWSMCRSDCDHIFTVCLDELGRGLDVEDCKYGRYQTTKIKNSNVNKFDKDFGKLPNPLSFIVPGPINVMTVLKINVMDADSGHFSGADDHVDDLAADIYVHKGPFAQITMPITIHSRTRMETQVVVSCAEHWYGEDCNTPCKPSQDDNFYCDGWTGDKICHPGWKGKECNEVDSY